MLDAIISNIIKFPSSVFRLNMDDRNQMEKTIFSYIEIIEFNVLAALDFNMNAPTGYDVLTSILKLSNEHYNFNPLLITVSEVAKH